jgi:hypothetical protein
MIEKRKTLQKVTDHVERSINEYLTANVFSILGY